MKTLLPLRSSGSSYEWAVGVQRVLADLSRGPAASRVKSGENLFDCILEMRHETGMQDYAMPENASRGLDLFFGKLLPQNLAREFFHTTLPSMAKLALDLPNLLDEHVNKGQLYGFGVEHRLRVLSSQEPGIVMLSQEFIACLLTCSFLCLYPSQDRDKYNLPGINLNKFYALVFKNHDRASQQHKMLCLLHYFERVCQGMPHGMVSYERKVLLPWQTSDILRFWSTSRVPLCKFQVSATGDISNHIGGEALEVDFANKYLGGGALRAGCVQEEIRFMTNPELIAGMLFLPMMEDNESIEIFGAECYSKYEGYGKSFTFVGDHQDERPRDQWGRRMTRIVAIDALARPGAQQYKSVLILREVNKAFCGFLDRHGGEDVGVATGNWGCGAFGGDLELKSLIQWLAASQAGRAYVKYYTFADPRAQRLEEIVEWMSRESWTVGDLWNILLDYGSKREAGVIDCGLFEWLRPVTGLRALFSQLTSIFSRRSSV
ncbi:hypothetical protein SELMODRAFT_77537 [Selaginella moellendorffii]|uniref:poly(ADP-ribose) glycohydrolase n=1 Tax=Selaginella moellendorffii TaxID=88036 RepID=D8QRZ2_SELML|nr:hypothetical protein SELMODRAFT_77537 [Selaginella moellendorffii]